MRIKAKEKNNNYLYEVIKYNPNGEIEKKQFKNITGVEKSIFGFKTATIVVRNSVITKAINSNRDTSNKVFKLFSHT